MLYNYCAKLGRDSAQYESCCSESYCSESCCSESCCTSRASGTYNCTQRCPLLAIDDRLDGVRRRAFNREPGGAATVENSSARPTGPTPPRRSTSTPSTHSPCCGWRRSGRSTPWSGRWRNSPNEMVWGVRASVHEHGVRWKRRAARAPVLWHWQLQVRTHTSGGLGPCFSASPKRNGFLLNFIRTVS